MQLLDTSHLEAEAKSFLAIMNSLSMDDLDVLEVLTRQLYDRAMLTLGPYICGLESEICVAFDSSNVNGDVLLAPDNKFAGKFRGVSSVLVNPEVSDDPLVPSLVFEPREISTGDYPDSRYGSAATLYPRVAVPLVGVPFMIEPVALVSSDYLYTDRDE